MQCFWVDWGPEVNGGSNGMESLGVVLSVSLINLHVKTVPLNGWGGALIKLPENAREMATLQYWVESARQPDDPESWQWVWTRRTQNSKCSYKKEKLGSVEHKLSDPNFFSCSCNSAEASGWLST